MSQTAVLPPLRSNPPPVAGGPQEDLVVETSAPDAPAAAPASPSTPTDVSSAPGPETRASEATLPLPRTAVADPMVSVERLYVDVEALLAQATSVVESLQDNTIDIHDLLIDVARQTRVDQRGGLDQAQTTIETNRRLRERIQEQMKKIQEQIQKLQEDIEKLQRKMKKGGFFGKIGEGIASAFGGGKGKKLKKKAAEMTKKQAKLKDVQAQLEKAKKLIEHGHQIMEETVKDLKALVERINQSINQLKMKSHKETTAIGRT